MRLIIVRHGETIDNIKKVFRGQGDGQLSERGIEQAKKVGIRFKDKKIDKVYSSDSKRAIDTTKEILKYHPDLKLNLDKRLRERSFGKLEGKPWPKNWDWNNFPDFVETDKALCERAKEFLDDTCQKNRNKTVLIVCHGGIKNAFITIIHNKSYLEFRSWEWTKNTGVSEFEIKEDGNHKIHFLNCIKHLA